MKNKCLLLALAFIGSALILSGCSAGTETASSQTGGNSLPSQSREDSSSTEDNSGTLSGTDVSEHSEGNDIPESDISVTEITEERMIYGTWERTADPSAMTDDERAEYTEKYEGTNVSYDFMAGGKVKVIIFDGSKMTMDNYNWRTEDNKIYIEDSSEYFYFSGDRMFNSAEPQYLCYMRNE